MPFHCFPYVLRRWPRLPPRCARGLLLRITHVISVVLLHHASVYSPHAVAHDYTFAIGKSVNVACMKAERNRRQTRHPKNVNSQISRSLDVHHALNQRRPYRSPKSPYKFDQTGRVKCRSKTKQP